MLLLFSKGVPSLTEGRSFRKPEKKLGHCREKEGRKCAVFSVVGKEICEASNLFLIPTRLV